MFLVCRVMLIWITTATLCVQALGPTMLFGCCCDQSRIKNEAASVDQMSHSGQKSCCRQQSQSASDSADKESCESSCAQMQTRCQCVRNSSEPALPEQTSPLQIPVSVFSALTVPPTMWTCSTAPVVRPVRVATQKHGCPSHFAQLLFCVSLT
ncbi:hypothetical protein Pan153_43520 [Gimesia panareensis]|uniref:Uncharacterized protein n=1 Tax=Gimesia panareensis TaxID=2527978 RepID=A0A518FTL5_9PLAN|nr:hypothetical protein [Gimesia panareensis]QDV19686.1 hypothetical protein Pan153_43520 [Gimesia panareensis]